MRQVLIIIALVALVVVPVAIFMAEPLVILFLAFIAGAVYVVNKLFNKVDEYLKKHENND